MNTSTFTTRHLHLLLRRICWHEEAITANTCGHDSTMCEIPSTDFTWKNTSGLGDFVKIKTVDEDNGILDIEWAVDYDESYEEAGDAWEFRYRTLIESSVVKNLLEQELKN